MTIWNTPRRHVIFVKSYFITPFKEPLHVSSIICMWDYYELSPDYCSRSNFDFSSVYNQIKKNKISLQFQRMQTKNKHKKDY